MKSQVRQPARKINNGGKDRVIGNFPSYKMGRSVEWDSQIERDYLFYLEFDGDVIEYHPQPIKYRYTLNKKYHTHYPDFEVVRKSTSRKKFVEIKMKSTTLKLEFIEKTKAIKAQMNRDDHDYAVVTDEDLRVKPILDNLKLLYRYIWEDTNPVKVKSLIKAVQEHNAGTISLLELRGLAENSGLALIDCYACIARGLFEFDLNTSLGPESILHVRTL